MAVIIGLLAGLGFIFIGTQFLTSNMKQVAGPGFQKLVSKATGHPVRASLVGIAAGAAIQSTNAVTFIVIGLVSAGIATVRSAMPIVTWSYVGSTLRLLLASFDLDLVILSGIAIIGMAYMLGYDRDARYRSFVAAMLGLFLLLYGVQIMVHASVPLRDSETLRTLLGFADIFYFWGLIAGTVLAAIIQGQTVAVITVALASGGVLDIDQTFLIIVGSNLGTGIMAVAQGTGLTGTARQLNLYQLLLKLIGTAIILPLLTIEHFTDIPLISAFITNMTSDPALQVTALHGLFQITAAVAASALNAPLFNLIESWSPPSVVESLSKPLFINNGSDNQGVVTVMLAEQEQRRLVRRLPHFLDRARGITTPTPQDDATTISAVNAPPHILRKAGDDLGHELDAFLKRALHNTDTEEEQDALMGLWNCNQTLHNLHASLGMMGDHLLELGKMDVLRPIAHALSEETYMMISAVISELEGFKHTSVSTIKSVTMDRSEALRAVRHEIMARHPGLDSSKQQTIWAIMDHMEHIAWLLRRFSLNLAEGRLGDEVRLGTADAV